MLFSEIYSCYYHTIAEIINCSLKGELNNSTMSAIIKDNAFSESSIDIPKALKSNKWPLIRSDFSTIIHATPTTPLTLLEKRWLKSLLSDPRIKLFDVSAEGLEDIDPLYSEDTFVRFDIYADGDPFNDPVYIENFRTLLKSIKQKRPVKISYYDNSGKPHTYDCLVDNLEYSLKNDKFRAVAVSNNRTIIINVSTINYCTLLDNKFNKEDYQPLRIKKELTAILYDNNNALDRAMICFSYLEKETTRIDNQKYYFKLRYFQEDEAEMLIQILSFGTRRRVTSPQDFINKLKQRILNQIKY